MRTGLLVISLIGCAGLYLSLGKNSRQLLRDETKDSVSHPVDFNAEVRPILHKNCSPCHFPGGKMYEKMPFDNGNTIIRLKDGVPKRISGEKEKSLIRAYIRQNTASVKAK